MSSGYPGRPWGLRPCILQQAVCPSISLKPWKGQRARPRAEMNRGVIAVTDPWYLVPSRGFFPGRKLEHFWGFNRKRTLLNC